MLIAGIEDHGGRLPGTFGPTGVPAYNVSISREVSHHHVRFWSVNAPEVHIACDWAWITYTNRGSAGDASGTQPMSWLESAVLHYHGQRWHIQFLHSTRAASTSN